MIPPSCTTDVKLLNIGCGDAYHRDWINIDLILQPPHVLQHDLKKGLPFKDEYFDACYSSHVLEHLSAEEGNYLIREQYRVLKPNGIIRIVVPDLECICRNYISFLEKLINGDKSVEFRYEFTLFELFDQFSRERSGGNYKRFIPPSNNDEMEFICQRWGRKILSQNNEKDLRYQQMHLKSTYMIQVDNFIRKLAGIRKKLAQLCVRFLIGLHAIEALRLGLFRMSGEVHKTTYDRYSVSRLLCSNAFVAIKLCSANESLIPDFSSYELDVVDGYPRKPDSLYIEARKGE